MMIFGGSPDMVAEPPRLAAKTWEMMKGTGSNFSRWARRTLATARKRMTVILSMNMDRKADRIMNATNRGAGL